MRYVHLPGAAVDTALLEDGKCSAYWTEDGMLTGDSDTERGCSAGFKGKVSVNWEHGNIESSTWKSPWPRLDSAI